ncbi:dihydrodipicolinate reductase [Frankia sp. CNm7]|uniref:Dihydrodipicolinate reductase n=1 Tax=Frankia nepalensis TaxID=1836974 RepID=A0A937UPU1_9ACTN|nr:dihydrodipicolinate reductase [Frankia nepalensis]MBL7501848.1 dihydrodipicolinate reductase [Frankia nepalensis]MBL7515018.1 dihydrodipicolinate reductase [Frankia nepalensis]MBL7518728.1 dihydrodipicolinate reductase [Frankia nepalensis]MBL7625936.1 dihydrodipicolinate reductase [Frankia nepalensis]
MPQERPYRVIQWATGSIGRISIRHFVDNPAYELVGVYVTNAEKAGVDAGTLAGLDPVGVAATGSVAEILAVEADCVNYAPLYADVDEMCQILRSGKSIVTPTGWVFPQGLANQKPVERLAAACREGGTSLYGAGIHPGFSGDLLPLTVARLCTRIDRITVQEVADLAQHPSRAMNFDGLGFGRDPDDARKNPSPLIHTMENIFRESMALLAEGLGIVVDEYTTLFDVAVTTRDLVVRSGEIPAGTVGGMRHEWIAHSGGRPTIVFRSFWKMADDLDPDWGYGTIKYSVAIDGEPSTTLTLAPAHPHPTGDEGYWGRVWTAMNAVNAIPAVRAAPPGIHTHLDLPLVRPVGLFRPEPARVVRS